MARTISRAEKIKMILNAARDMLGTPYEFGACYATAEKGKPKGVDCSSFTQYVFRQAGITLPRSSLLQAAAGRTVKSVKNLKPGDLLFFEGVSGHYSHKIFPTKKTYIGHVALYIGNGNIIHARSSTGRVDKQELSALIQNPDYRVKLIKRVI